MFAVKKNNLKNIGSNVKHKQKNIVYCICDFHEYFSHNAQALQRDGICFRFHCNSLEEIPVKYK